MRLFRLLAPAIVLAIAFPAGAVEDRDIERVLVSSPWCLSVKAGDPRSEKALFGRDGVALVSGNTGADGKPRSERFRWRVQRGTLLLSEDGTNWTPIDLKVNREGGSDAIAIDGDGYRPCR